MSSSPFDQIGWSHDRLGIVVLDQTRLPSDMVYVTLDTVEAIEEAIISLRVRGAPLIGITGAMGLAVLLNRANSLGSDVAELRNLGSSWADRLSVARPTAVNLTWAIERMRRILEKDRSSAESLVAAALDEADQILAEDIRMCRAIGENGVALLENGSRVLTHCNAGALATGGIGTALSPVYVGHEKGLRIQVYADETRPLLQGGRLTAWELDQAGIEVTVLTDGMAGALMSIDPPDIILVGADRIAANGDVANKIGTYGLAVLAGHHGIPFYVLAPTSTIDFDTVDGSEIPIEHRSADEIRRGFGSLTVPENVPTWNPSFDVTPSELVTGIITERGIHSPPFSESLSALLMENR